MPAETRALLAEAMDRAARYIELVPDPNIGEYARATARISDATSGRLALVYDPRYAHELGYLVAHECGHIIRLYSVPEAFRVVPVTTTEHRAGLAKEGSQLLARLHRAGMPESALGRLLNMWLEGIVRQVWNFPADMRIERWLKGNYPGLASLQETALRGQVEENQRTLPNSIKEMTPAKVYHASNVMNSAYARYISRLLESRQVFSVYRRSDFGDAGRRLADEIWDSEDRGYFSDVEDATRWAEILGIEEWFEWRPL